MTIWVSSFEDKVKVKMEGLCQLWDKQLIPELPAPIKTEPVLPRYLPQGLA